MRQPKIIIVGGGLAGLMATIRAAESGLVVDLFSIVPVKRSHSVCAQGGINAAKNQKGEGDTTDKHFDDTIYGGDFLANQPLVKRMCEAAPGIIDLLDRMGVMFNRTPEGLLDYRRFGGTLYHRTAFAGATTGQQLLYALDEQVRRHEAEGRVKKFEGWTFLSAVIDEGRVCRGICGMDLRSMEIRTFPADAVIFATGGIGAIFGRSTNSVVCTGSAQSALFQQGVDYANGEFIQVHPTAIPGEDKLRLMSESARGEGGRVWVPRNPAEKRHPKDIPESDRFYFLEEWYPKYGNLVPRDIATRAIHRIVYQEKLGLDGQAAVYLDVSHIPRETLNRKLEGILEIYEKFLGVDPREEPMKVFPGMHYTMGGIWVNGEDQATNVPGILAAGECEYQYHGANRLGANSLVSCIFGGGLAGTSAVKYVKNLEKGAEATAQAVYESERKSGRKESETDPPGRLGKPSHHLARTGRLDDRARHGDAHQQEFASHACEDSNARGSLQENQLERPRQVVQPDAELRARAGKHAGAVPGSYPRGLGTQRIAWRALQAGVPRPRRCQLAQDHARQVGQLRRSAYLRAGGHFFDQAARAPIRRGEVTTRSGWLTRERSDEKVSSVEESGL